MEWYSDFIDSMNKGKLVVMLENCLKDVSVPRKDKKCNNDVKQEVLSSLLTGNKLTARVELNCIENCNNEHLTNSDAVSSEEEYLHSGEVKPNTQGLSLEESLLDTPNYSSCAIASEERTEGKRIKEKSLLSWKKLVESPVCEAETPLASANSSRVDIDLTPPSSVGEDRSFEESFILDSDDLPCKAAKIKVNDKSLKHNNLSVDVIPHEPTLRQLQVLYRRNSPSGLIHNNCTQNRKWPKRKFKPFIPFMFEHSMYIKKQRKKMQQRKHSHTPPKANNTSSVQKKRNGQNTKRLKLTRKEKKVIEIKELRVAQKQKEAFQKKQLKLALKQKKEALKHRNRFENSLDSINRRISNQNSFWRMLAG